jgi:2-iminobutanoate/2-iminopropanoate deaminase
MKIIETAKAPKPIGPYSQATLTQSGLLFISGQVGIDPKTSQLVGGGIENEAVQVLDNIEAILAEADLNWKNVVRTEIFILNMADFAFVNQLYAKRFGNGPYPARYTVQVSGLPGNALIEIVCTAEIF